MKKDDIINIILTVCASLLFLLIGLSYAPAGKETVYIERTVEAEVIKRGPALRGLRVSRVFHGHGLLSL